MVGFGPSYTAKSLEEKMATHSYMFLPGKSHEQRSFVGYSPWGHRRARHNLETNNFTFFLHVTNIGYMILIYAHCGKIRKTSELKRKIKVLYDAII